MERSKIIFGNEISNKDYKKACNKKKKYQKKYSKNEKTAYGYEISEAPVISKYFNALNIKEGENTSYDFPDNAIVVGNIRMGFGHYRIAMAIASAAASMGYKPYWFDLLSFPSSACTKIVEAQNNLYSLGSRISQKSYLFNKFVWEPINSEGFRKLTYNATDNKVSELFAPIVENIPKDVPFVSTHAWCAQAALHANMNNVVSAVCDNWPMALHLAEGSTHTIQTRSAYIGYKCLRGMDKKRALNPMDSDSIAYTGHYIDHEIVSNIPSDTERRINKLNNNKPLTYLLTIGGAGAQSELFAGIIKHLLPKVKKGQANLLINFGDHFDAYTDMCKMVKQLDELSIKHFDDFEEIDSFSNNSLENDLSGLHVFCNKEIFSAVYTTNLLMRICDVMLTKPSELAFYPVPKLMLKRVGGHEAYGAFHSSEVGDGTYECETLLEVCSMIDTMEKDTDILSQMNSCILTNNKNGLYNGAYKVVELAFKNK